jgi:hypothetical protein
MTDVEIRVLGQEDADACDAIIAGLPYHFAHDQGKRDRAAAVRRDPGLVATEGADVAGFLTYVHRFDEARISPGWRSAQIGGAAGSVTR